MKKLWGFVLCLAVMCAAGAGALLATVSGQNVAEASVPERDWVKVMYYDDNQMPRVITDEDGNESDNRVELTKNASQDYNIVTFGDDIYEGRGACIGTTGYFSVTLGVGQSADRADPGRNSEWIRVYRAAMLPETTTGDIDYSALNYSEKVGEYRYDTFNFTFNHMGIYRVQISTTHEGLSNSYVNTFIFVVGIDLPAVTGHFTDRWAYDEYPDRTEWYSNALDTPKTLGFVTPDGYGSYNPRIADVAGIKVIVNGTENEPDFFDITYDTVEDKFVFNIAEGKKSKNGTYIVTFYVQFNIIQNIGVNGVAQTLSAEQRRVEVQAVLYILDPSGYQFPWQGILICIAILGVLAGAWYGINRLLRYVQGQHAIKQSKATEEREKIDKENLEKLREHIMAEEL